MRISRRATAVAAAALAGLGTLAATSAAVASSGTHDGGQVLQFRTIGVSTAVADAGHGGPANVVALFFDIRTESGAEAGKAYISCTIVTRDEQLCHAAFVLTGGQIEAQAAIPLAATNFPAAVTGGTGIYEGVTGQVDNVVSGPGVIDRTFHLIQPGG